jgi:hypothetical protein
VVKIARNISIALVLLILVLIVAFYKADIPAEELKQKYAIAPSQFDSVKGMSVHYRDEGPASDSIPLVLLHGTSSSIFTWDACVKEWIREHRVIRMDLPGFALTGPDPNSNYSIEGYVAFVHEFLQRRNVNQCYLAGPCRLSIRKCKGFTGFHPGPDTGVKESSYHNYANISSQKEY